MSAITKATTEDDEMLVEYHLDYSKSQPNRFIQETGQRAILLDADIASVFTDPDQVNEVLRSLIPSMLKVTQSP